MIIETCPKCGNDLLESVICTMPPISRKECSCCGWSWESGPETVLRVPFKELRQDIRIESLTGCSPRAEFDGAEYLMPVSKLSDDMERFASDIQEAVNYGN